MLSQTKCFLLLLACGWLAPYLVASDDLKWNEFMCEHWQKEEMEDDVRFLVYMDGYLYFFFKDYVLRYDQPASHETLDIIDYYTNHFMMTKVGTYIEYEKLKERPSLLRLDPDLVTGFIYFASVLREERNWTNLAAISETKALLRAGKSDLGDYTLDVWKMKLNESQGALGEIGDADPISKLRLRKPKEALGAVWADGMKWFETSYVRDYIVFSVYEMFGDKNETQFRGSATIDKIPYLTKHMAFYQADFQGTLYSDFKGYLFDVDVEKNARLWRLGFVTYDAGKFLLQIKEKSNTIPIRLTELLDCDVTTISLRQFKGVFIYQYPSGSVRSFLFADNYYFKSKYDLVKINFKLDLGRPEGIMRVEFEDYNNRPGSDRLSMKYIKNWESKFYATFNPDQTHELTFKGEGDNEKLLAIYKPDFKLHRCVGSILTMPDERGGIYAFCITRKHYVAMGKEEDVSRYFVGFPLEDVFRNTNVEWGNQDIETVFWYKELNSVVFMTLDWLLVFERSLFIAKGEDRLGEKSIALTQYGNITNYTRLKNCMWRGCDDKAMPKMKTRKVMSTAGRKRQGAL